MTRLVELFLSTLVPNGASEVRIVFLLLPSCWYDTVSSVIFVVGFVEQFSTTSDPEMLVLLPILVFGWFLLVAF
jgi:hypothetical protein